jgi:superfamily II DNA or RNA helicase
VAGIERCGKQMARILRDWHGELMIGEACVLQERWKDAVDHLQRALDRFPPKKSDPEVRKAFVYARRQHALCARLVRDGAVPAREKPTRATSASVPELPIAPRGLAAECEAAATDAPSPPAKPDIFAATTPPVIVQSRFDPSAVEGMLTAGSYDSLAAHRLNVQAHRIMLVAGFEDLLCLHTLRGVERFGYQVETVRRVLRQFRGRALLCDEVGLGKTIEAGMVLKEYILRGLARRILVLVPPSLVSQWQEELAAKFDLAFASTNDPAYRRDSAAFWADNERVIASLASAKREPNFSLIANREYDMVVIDEAHHLKNRTTLNWKLGNALRSRFLLMLTATPVQNDLMELHNLITLLRPGQLRTASVFNRRFRTRGEPLTPANRDELRSLLAEVMIRNRRSDVNIALPKRYASTVRLSLDPDEAALYERVSAFVRTSYPTAAASRRLLLTTLQMEAGSSPFALAATLENLAGSSAFPEAARELHALAEQARAVRTSAKGTHLLRVLREKDERKLIFTHYRATLKYIAGLLDGAGISHARFDGTMSPDEKDESVARFRAGEVQILLSTESGGEGRNLQFCSTIVNYDLPWNPMRIEQRIGRVHRIGQTRDVFVFNFSAKGTLEDHLLDVLDRKINMFELVVGEVDMILGNLTDERDFPDIVMDLWAGAASTEEAAARFRALGEELLAAKRSYEETRALDDALFGDDYEV